MKTISDRDLAKLVDAARSGEEAAMAALIEATQSELFRFLVFLTGNRVLAQDIAQDAYIKVMESLSSLRDSNTFSAWLFRTAKNIYIDHTRSPRNAKHEDIDELVNLAMDEDQAAAVREVQDLLKELEAEDRYAMLLVYLEGYSYAEAADRLGISEDAMRSRLHRIREHLAKRKA